MSPGPDARQGFPLVLNFPSLLSSFHSHIAVFPRRMALPIASCGHFSVRHGGILLAVLKTCEDCKGTKLKQGYQGLLFQNFLPPLLRPVDPMTPAWDDQAHLVNPLAGIQWLSTRLDWCFV